MHALARLSEIDRVKQEIVSHLRKRLAEAQISLSAEQALILARLDNKPRHVGYVATMAHFGSNISYNLGILEQRGYLTRSSAPGDRRLTVVELTEDGRAIRAFIINELEGLPALDADKLTRRLVAA
jgi:DNA-binding MarR family transcriptional regulator